MKPPTSIQTKEQLLDYLLQFALNKHGASPKLVLDGIRGRKTEAALNGLVNATLGEVKHSPIPQYARLAHDHLGLVEIPGAKSNPTILGWIKSVFPWAKDDGEIAWCAIFINEMLRQSGLKGTGKANAKSFLNWGRKVTEPRKGDIVVFDRGTQAWQGHVGIYWGEDAKGRIYCLGGNQANKVSIALYSQHKIEGFRRAE